MNINPKPFPVDVVMSHHPPVVRPSAGSNLNGHHNRRLKIVKISGIISPRNREFVAKNDDTLTKLSRRIMLHKPVHNIRQFLKKKNGGKN